MKPLLLGAAQLLEWFEAWIAQACCGSTTRTPSAPSTGCCRLMCPPPPRACRWQSPGRSPFLERSRRAPCHAAVASSDRGLNGGTRPCLFRRPRPLVQNLGDIFNQRQKLTRKLAFQPSLASLPQTDESCMKAAQWFQSNLNSRRERSKKQASQEQQRLR